MRAIFLSIIITLLCFGRIHAPPALSPVSPQDSAVGQTVDEQAETAEQYFSVTPSFNTGSGSVEEHFTVNLPKSWRNDCVVEYYEMDFTYSVSFCEKNSHEAGFGGHLFTVYADSVGEDYSYLPAYEVIGTLVKDGYAHWTLVAMYPTDVQFDVEYYEKYNEMTSQIPEILENITAAEGYTFIRGEL